MNMELIEDYNKLNNYLATVNLTNESLGLLVSAYDNIDTNIEVSKENIVIAKHELGYTDDIEISQEGIKEFILMVIEKLKTFFKKVWVTFFKLVTKLRKKMILKDKEVDEMIYGLNKNYSTEDSVSKAVSISIPYFLDITNNDDKLTYLEYFFNKLVTIKTSVYITIDDYLGDIKDNIKMNNLKNVDYSKIFNKNTARLYNNDHELAKILANLYDSIMLDANTSKYVIGYDSTFVHIFDSSMDTIHKVGYKNDSINVYIPNYIPNLNKHLNNLKEFTKFIKREERVLSTINNNMTKITKLLTSFKNKELDKTELEIISSYVRDITSTIPSIFNSFELCSISMYNGYKKILKEIYSNIDN